MQISIPGNRRSGFIVASLVAAASASSWTTSASWATSVGASAKTYDAVRLTSRLLPGLGFNYANMDNVQGIFEADVDMTWT